LGKIRQKVQFWQAGKRKYMSQKGLWNLLGDHLAQSLRESEVMVVCHFVRRDSVAPGRRRSRRVIFSWIVEKLDLTENPDL
jgi:hypothetical protein